MNLMSSSSIIKAGAWLGQVERMTTDGLARLSHSIVVRPTTIGSNLLGCAAHPPALQLPAVDSKQASPLERSKPWTTGQPPAVSFCQQAGRQALSARQLPPVASQPPAVLGAPHGLALPG